MSDIQDTVLHVGGAAPYDVVIGRDLADRLPGILGESVQRVALIHSERLDELVAPLLTRLNDSFDVLALGVPDGERAKSAEVAYQCWEALGEAGFTRSDAIVTFGGGATTDMGGFVAATWLRGVRVIHVPTTLLAMVDASVGGKTGINTAAGKNLVGSFHEPAGVLCDLDLLRTLPGPELVAGMGEVVKCGFIADPEILRLVEADPSAALDVDGPVLRELVERSVRVKIDVVVADLKETGGVDGHPGREILNYGHTMAHAIERATSYGIRHGEAVAIGCCFAAEVARTSGLLSDEVADRHRTAFAAVGLPIGFDGAEFDELETTMRVDKKSRGSQLRFVVLHDLADPRILAGPTDRALRAAYAVMTKVPR
ncbi:3-dehydroquinate synthase [Nocardioides sp.]|uniref:3-dehydroquinate synthase n=1 Tax=Nocardioides sp. TaxID=35761 RepID=UPI003D150E0A